MRSFSPRMTGSIARFVEDCFAQDEAPAAVALFPEVVMAGHAAYVAEHAVDPVTLLNLHFGLRDGAGSVDLDRSTAEQMQDASAPLHQVMAAGDEFFETRLFPGGGHAAVWMPDFAELIPVCRVAPDNPVFNELPNDGPVLSVLIFHARFLLADAQFLKGFGPLI